MRTLTLLSRLSAGTFKVVFSGFTIYNFGLMRHLLDSEEKTSFRLK